MYPMTIKNKRLERHVQQAAWDVEYAIDHEHWISSDGDGDPDEGLSYCLKCGEALVKELNEEEPDGCYVLRSGDTESDHLPFCETCGDMLDFGGLTECGVDEELAHYEEHGLDPTHPACCYAIVTAYHCAQNESTERRFEAILDRAAECHFWLLPRADLDDLVYMWT